MILHRLPSCVRGYYSVPLWLRFPSHERKLYLTFDDGPSSITPQLLDILDAFHAKATFFCKGENAAQQTKLLSTMEAAGHRLGNHTFHHLNGWKTNTEQYLEDVEQCKQWVDSRLFRPPYGRISRNQARKLVESGYQIVLWSLLTEDYNPSLPAEKCLQKAIQRTRKGDVVLFHDSEKAAKNVLYVLPKYLEHFANQGYSFETIPS